MGSSDLEVHFFILINGYIESLLVVLIIVRQRTLEGVGRLYTLVGSRVQRTNSSISSSSSSPSSSSSSSSSLSPSRSTALPLPLLVTPFIPLVRLSTSISSSFARAFFKASSRAFFDLDGSLGPPFFSSSSEDSSSSSSERIPPSRALMASMSSMSSSSKSSSSVRSERSRIIFSVARKTGSSAPASTLG